MRHAQRATWSTAFLAIVAVMGAGCVRPDPETEQRLLEAERRALAAEAEGGALAAERDALRARLGELEPAAVKDAEPPKDGAPPCPANVTVVVRDEQGTDCSTWRAEIAGWSEACVSTCDPATRLGELVAAAQAECQAFCASKGCAGGAFAAPARCALVECADPSKCPPQCRKRDACFLLQAAHVFNCSCLVVEG